jgi:uncharacterized membrane protein YbhN (UPF0104 family)
VKPLLKLASRALALGRKPAVRWGVGAVAVGLAVWAVAAEWDEVTAALRSLDPEAVVLALVATIVNVALAGMVWRTLLADLGSRVSLPVAARIFFVGQLGKYVPGSVWPVVMQAELGRDHRVPRQRTATATLVTLLLGIASALLVVLLAIPFDSRVVPPGFEWAVVLVVPLLIALHPAVLNWGIDRILRILGREAMEHRTSLRGTALATLWAIGSWIAAGLQVYVLAVALGAPPGIDTASLAIGGYTLAWAVGFVVIVAPAGAGAREVALAAVLAPVLTGGEVIVVVLVSRLLFTAVDLAAAGLGLAAGHRHRVPVGPNPKTSASKAGAGPGPGAGADAA